MDIKKFSYYLNESKKIKREIHQKKIRISFLGSFTLNGFDETIKVQCNEEKINCVTYIGPYNQFNQEILNEDSNWYKFNSDITFLIIDNRTILEEVFYFPYKYSEYDRKQIVEDKFIELKTLIERVIENTKSKLILTNFVIPTYSPFGIFESKTEFGLKDMILELNKKLKNLCKDFDSVYLYDFNSFVTKIGENNVLNNQKMFFGDIKISFDSIPYLINDLMGFVKPVLGLNKKCIVLDLDNTLWGGIIGEDGIEGIKLGLDPAGRPFIEFQKMIKALVKRGIILAINSKNNFEDAIKVIKEHPYMVLKEDDFACLKINWNDKIANMKDIANELNIGLDSMVFFDDDPSNRELIRMSIPEIKVIELPKDPSEYPTILQELNDFNVLKVTEDDFKRSKMYKQERERRHLESKTENLSDYLRKLEIKVEIHRANQFLIPRIAQLTLKTNQFNLTTKRYQEEEIKKISTDEKMLVGCSEVRDKFGDSGITNVFIIKKDNDEWILDTFLLSCRIMGKGIEEGILGKILEMAKKENIKRIRAKFIPTQKNRPSKNFLADNGFVHEGDDWIFNLDKSVKIPEHLEVKFE